MARRALTAFLLIISPFLLQVGHSSPITFMTHSIEGKTSIDENGELRGVEHAGRRAFHVELIREMMKLMQHPVELKEVPFKRGFRDVQQKPDHALFNVSRTGDREDTVKWVGPIHVSSNYFFELKSAPTGIQTLKDAKKVDCISVLDGNVHHNYLVKNGFTNLEPTNSYPSTVKMLVRERCSLIPSSGSGLPDRLIELDLSPDTIVRTPVMLFESKGYIALSKNVPDAEVQKWQDALEQLKESGKYEELEKKFLALE
jgi:polar amino acid transport system substrate-binding protein